MSAELRWIRGAARRPRYVGVGRPTVLYRKIDDLQGGRALLERVALASVGRFGRLLPVRDPTIREAWLRLNRAVPDIESALLIYTGFYKKNSVLSGVIDTGQSRFVKVFSEPNGHEAESGRLDDLRKIVPRSVVLARIELEGDGVIAYELLERSGRHAPQRVLEDVAMKLGVNAYREARRSNESVDDTWRETVVTTQRLLAEFGSAISNETASKLRRLVPLRTIAHGDFTPWNAFLSRQGRVALVDYERVGHHVPFTDAWHLATQPLALRGRIVPPTALLARVRDAAECDDRCVCGWYCAYLVQELNQDVSDWVIHGHHYARLRRVIVSKTRLLQNAISKAEVP